MSLYEKASAELQLSADNFIREIKDNTFKIITQPNNGTAYPVGKALSSTLNYSNSEEFKILFNNF